MGDNSEQPVQPDQPDQFKNENIQGSVYDLDSTNNLDVNNINELRYKGDEKRKQGGRRRSSSVRKSSAKKRASRRKPRSAKKRASRRYRHRRA
jgi:hypothetical protein